MAWGFDPEELSADPYQGAYRAVAASLAKLVAAGADYRKAYLTLQEFFEKLRDEPLRWGKPLAALLGALDAQLDYGAAAIGIMNMTPPESAVIAADIAVKSGDVYLGFADRFTGTVIITGELADVTSALTEIVNYFRDELGYVVCRITKR